jgi:hypothetical protein
MCALAVQYKNPQDLGSYEVDEVFTRQSENPDGRLRSELRKVVSEGQSEHRVLSVHIGDSVAALLCTSVYTVPS